MNKLRKNLRGFTLMEVLVALAISTLMLTAVLALIAPSTRMYHKTTVLQQQRQICRTINTGINERLRFATDVVVIKNTSGYPNCVGDKYKDYSAIRISEESTTYKGKAVKGRIYLMDKLATGDENQMLSDASYEKYNYDFNITASGYDIINEIKVYRIDAKGNTVDKLDTKNTIRLKNYELKLETLLEIDASTMTSQPISELEIKSSGENIIILYKQ